MRKKERLFVVLMLAAFCFGSAGFITNSWGQAPTHTVREGDTLWSICQEYYGDPELWPKLWEMNPFITNPHLLRVGDVITLMEKEAEEPLAVEPEVAEPAKAMEESVQREMGVDVSGMTNVESIGFFSQVNPEPLGSVLSSESHRLLSSEGDIVSISVEGSSSIRLGDVLIAYDIQRLFKDALERHDLGYVVRVLGKLVVREEVEGSLYKAEISESYAPIPPGAMIGPHAPISSCVKPVPMDSEVNTSIIASKGLRFLISQFSVVYLSLGYDDGIRRGNVFEIVGERPVESADKADLYTGILGHMLVLETRPDTATGVVISARREFSKEVSLRGLDLTKAQEILSKIPECPIE